MVQQSNPLIAKPTIRISRMERFHQYFPVNFQRLSTTLRNLESNLPLKNFIC